MPLEAGIIVEGRVTGITKFGAFVELPGGETGMVHISEVALTYVKEIRDFLTENQMVKVKVLSVGEDGKIALSIKKAIDPPPDNQNRRPRPPGFDKGNAGFYSPKSSEPVTFEDMLNKFKATSDEKISSLKRGNETRRGGSRRGGGK